MLQTALFWVSKMKPKSKHGSIIFCSYLCVGETWLESSECSLESLVSSQDNIGFLSFNGSSLISLGDNGVCSKSNETIN